jgi:hypothetical protein
MNRGVTVIGAGATGMATSAYLAEKGWDVTLCDSPEQADSFPVIEKQGGIRLKGTKDKLTKPARLTSDFKEAVESNSLVLVCVSLKRHSEIMDICLPYAFSGQSYLFSPGNFGSFLMKKKLRGLDKTGIITADLSGNLWACRSPAKGEVFVATPFEGSKRLAAYPSSETPEAIESFSPLMKVEPCTNILEALLNSPNVVSHVGGAVLNAVQIEKMGKNFAYFLHGLGEISIRCIKRLEEERNSVLDALGLHTYSRSSEEFNRKLMDYGKYPELDNFRSLDGPSDFSHRYITEDAACGVSLLISVARRYSIPVPLTEAFIAIAGVINNTNYLETGYTLEYFGLGELDKKTLIKKL